MSRVKLDLKMFQHVKSDKDSTTLRHKDGHELKIAHGPLSKDARNQLEELANGAMQSIDKKMAEGGGVADTSGYDAYKQDKPTPTPKPKDNKKWIDSSEDSYKSYSEDKNKKAWAEGGKVQRMAEGGPPTDVQAPGGVIPTDMQSIYNGTADTIKEMDKRDLQNKYDTAVIENERRIAPFGGAAFPPIHNTSLFGPKGQPPQNIDPDAAAIAKERFDQQKLDEAKQLKESQDKDLLSSQRAAEASKMLGIEQPPVPGVTPVDQANGSTVPTQPAGKDPGPPPAQAQGLAAAPEDYTAGMARHAQQYEQLGKQGLEEQAAVAKQQGLEEQAAHQQHLTDMNQAVSHYDNIFKAIQQERMHTIEDINNGHIDPDKYWTGHKDPATGEMVGGHSKIAAGIGMILAGFNPTSNPNAAINFLKYQIDKNVESQKANLDSQHNLLRANLQHFGNLQNALAMTRLQMTDMAVARLGVAAAKAKTAGADAAAKLGKSLLEKDMIPLAGTLAARQAISTLGQAGGSPGTEAAGLQRLMMYAPDVYKEMQPKFVPNLGFADNPVSAGQRDSLLSHQKFDIAAKDLQDFLKSHGGLASRLNIHDRDIAAQKALNIQALFREGTLGTVYREGEQPLLDKAIKGQPLDLLNYFREPAKIQEMQNSNKRAYDALRIGLGGTIAMRARQELSQQAQAQRPSTPEGATASNSVTGKQMVFKGGRWVPVTK